VELAPIFSNRSASFLKLSKVNQALADAERCVELRPQWDKAHFRKAAALEAAEDDDKALKALEVGKPKTRRQVFSILCFVPTSRPFCCHTHASLHPLPFRHHTHVTSLPRRC
jgi:hypothetical protein